MASADKYRVCNKCNILKPIFDFRKRTNSHLYRRECKRCEVKMNKVYQDNNKEKVREKSKKYEQKNKEKIAEQRKIWKLNNPDYYKKHGREYRKKNREKILEYNREYQKNKYHNDIDYKLRILIGGRIRRILTQKKIIKDSSTMQLLGCSLDFFKNYIENKFIDGMTWDELKDGRIHLDHVRPCSSFNLSKKDDLKACFHYTNLQPLWAEDNLKKGSKYYEFKI